MKKKKILFWIIIIIGIAIRIYGWPNIISAVNCDEAMTAINANAIVETGKDMYGTSFPVYLEAWRSAGQSVFLMYCISICIKILGYSLLAVRLPMLIISIICLFIFYDLCKRIFKDENIALIGLFMVAISPWHILQSIWSIDCNMFPHMLLISIYVLYRGLENKKFLYLSMILFGITMYTYGVAIYVVPFLLLIVGIYLLRHKEISIRQLILCSIIYIVVSLPILAMFIINGFGIEKNINIGPMTIQYFKYNVRTKDMLFFSDDFGRTLINNIKALLKMIFIQYDQLEWNASIKYGTIYRISLIFIFIALAKLVKTKMEKKKLPKELFILVIWLLISLGLGFVINDVNINRLNVIWYPLIIFATYGISLVANKDKFVAELLMVMYCVLFLGFSIYLHTEYCHMIDMSWCFSGNYLNAIEYADSLNKEKLIYSNVNRNEKADAFIKFQTGMDDQECKEIINNEQINESITNLNETEVLVIKDNEYDQEILENTNYKIEKINEYLVIYK